MTETIQHKDTVPESCLGKRLDQTIAEMFPDYSRSRLKDWILGGNVQVNGNVITKAREKMYGGEQITIDAEIEAEVRFEAQDIALMAYANFLGMQQIHPRPSIETVLRVTAMASQAFLPMPKDN